MSDLMLWMHNITSGVLVLLCWWLAHQNARTIPPGRLIAVGYSLGGFCLLMTALARNLGDDLDIPILLTKAALILTFCAVLWRRGTRQAAIDDAMSKPVPPLNDRR